MVRVKLRLGLTLAYFMARPNFETYAFQKVRVRLG